MTYTTDQNEHHCNYVDYVPNMVIRYESEGRWWIYVDGFEFLCIKFCPFCGVKL